MKGQILKERKRERKCKNENRLRRMDEKRGNKQKLEMDD